MTPSKRPWWRTKPSRETWRRVRRTAAQAAIATLGAGAISALLRRDAMAFADAAGAGMTVIMVAGLQNWLEDSGRKRDRR